MSDPVTKYVKKAREAGHPDHAIKKALLDAGHPHEAIAHHFPLGNKDFPHLGWLWPFYIYGWLNILNLLMWIYIIGSYFEDKRPDKNFFDHKFHNRIATFGFFWAIFIALIALIILVVQ